MSKGIIYIMTTAVPGLIKIGKTGSANFEQRMYNLEHDGYRNVTALKISFAGSIVMNQSNNGWTDRKDKDGNPVDIYRKKNDN